MRLTPAHLLLLPFLFFAPVQARAQKSSAEPAPEAAKSDDGEIELDANVLAMAKKAASLKYKSGQIDVGSGRATLKLPDTYRYLDPSDAKTVLEDLWGNPSGESLGMIFPADVGPTDDGSWGVVITYDEEGYVDDKDAAKINYSELLTDMKKDMGEANEERKKAGFEAVELVGWAEPPHYDSAAKKLYWAKELKFGAAPENTLNYNIRVLGRRGVLVLNAVASKSQLETVRAGMGQVMTFVDFNSGHRYADYVPGTDKLAAYGIGALIAGKVAAKAGLFKGLIALLIAGKKFVVIALAAAASAASKLFGRKKDTTEANG